MAKSRYEYVKEYELDDTLTRDAFLVIRLDGKGFHRFSDLHNFTKPNDKRALDLMNEAAKQVMLTTEVGRDVRLAFGESDEMSFVMSRNTKVYRRRAAKILTTFVSVFTSFYIRLWPLYFPNSPLDPYSSLGPSFDGRVIIYASKEVVKDYVRWRQTDTHINNLYNTCFWSLVQGSNYTKTEAHKYLQGTVSSQKNELLFTGYNINYNNIDPIFRKGSILLWSDTDIEKKEPEEEEGEGEENSTANQETTTNTTINEADTIKNTNQNLKQTPKKRKTVKIIHDEIYDESWWKARPRILA